MSDAFDASGHQKSGARIQEHCVAFWAFILASQNADYDVCVRRTVAARKIIYGAAHDWLFKDRRREPAILIELGNSGVAQGGQFIQETGTRGGQAVGTPVFTGN